MTETVKHTQGPWMVGKSHSLLVFDSSKEGWAIADARTYHGKFSRKEGEANARLIAAAPEMLEALKAAIANSDANIGPYGRTPEAQAVYDQVSDAIAKAEGRS